MQQREAVLDPFEVAADVRLSVEINRRTYDVLKEVAEQHDRSVGTYIADWLSEHLGEALQRKVSADDNGRLIDPADAIVVDAVEVDFTDLTAVDDEDND